MSYIPDMIDKTDILRLEELSLNAVPGIREIFYDGWIIRANGGHTHRGNSVQVLYESSVKSDTKIDFCEQTYRQIGQRSMFKLTDGTVPSDLDDRLEERGYFVEAPVLVQTAGLESFRPLDDVELDISDSGSDEWFRSFFDMYGITKPNRPAFMEMVKLIVPTHAFFSIRRDGIIVATGLAVYEAGTVGLFDIACHGEYRRLGLGCRISKGILSWARRMGAARAYLQVVRQNEAAIGLYEGLGFETAYNYWYRIKEI